MEVDLMGDRRKELVAAIGAYLALPTYAYRVGEYEIRKNGVLTGPDNPKMIEMLESNGFEIK